MALTGGHVPGSTGHVNDHNLIDAELAAHDAALSALKFDVRNYGAVWDGITDDTLAIQSAINAAPPGGIVRFPPGNGKITAPLSISQAISLVGASTLTTRLVAAGCDGIHVAAGTSDVHISDLSIAQSVRYSATTNSFVGLVVDGTAATHTSGHVYRDVFIDGFQTACSARYLWYTIFDNFQTNYGLIGIIVYGLSVNNTVVNSTISATGLAGSRCIVFAGVESPSDSTPVANEGWIISNSILFNSETAIDSFGTTHIFIVNNIIDFCSLNGINISAKGIYFGGNFHIIGNYIAMSGAAGNAAINLINSVSNVQNTGNRVQGNYLLTYAGCATTVGIMTALQGRMNAHGNTINGFSVDIELVGDGNIVVGNHCLSTPGAAGNIYVVDDSHHSLVADNTGIVYLTGGTPNVYRMSAMGKRIYSGLNAPVVGTYAWGDSVENVRPTVGQPKGWTCTVAGSPGTWVSLGNL